MDTVKGHFGSVSFDGTLVHIEKKARGRQSIPLAAIAAISIENAGIGMRAIRFSVAGGSIAGAQSALGSHKEAAQDPFALTFRKKDLGAFQDLATRIQAAQTAAS